MVTTVIFDLDDALYDEVDYCRSGFKATAAFLAELFASHSAREFFGAIWQEFESGNNKTVFNAAMERLGIKYDKALIDKLIEVYRTHKPDIKLPSDSKDVLEQLVSKYQLALLTDGFMPAQELKVKALGIEKYFKAIMYTELLGRQYWKPSPLGFEKLLAQLNAEAQKSVYVADNETKDFIAPNKLGFKTIKIIRPAGVHRHISGQPMARAGYVIDQIAKLPALLEKL